MKVFLSWSGDRSKAAARALREWLPFINPVIKPWMSAKDIESGARWDAAIQEELTTTKFGIVVVTETNTAAPWLLFEAGALAKTVEETFVCPYLIGMRASDVPAGPLARFQARVSDREGTLLLVQTINRALKEQGIEENRLNQTFEKWWPDLERGLSLLPDEKAGSPPRKTDDMVAEILDTVRRLDHQSPESSYLVAMRRAMQLKQGVELSNSELKDFLARKVTTMLRNRPDLIDEFFRSPPDETGATEGD